MRMNEKTCVIGGCGRVMQAKGLCMGHYQSMRDKEIRRRKRK